jgi:hypothetical protein
MEFEKRLERAIERGQRTRDQRGRSQAEQAVSEEELRSLHSQYRIDLSEHIEACLRRLADHFPGFRFETIVSDDGWGAKISRDDVQLERGRGSRTAYSRLEMLIRPYSSTHIVELVAKGTVRNKELYNRSHYQMLSQVDIDSFKELIDLWALEYAERFAAHG